MNTGVLVNGVGISRASFAAGGRGCDASGAGAMGARTNRHDGETKAEASICALNRQV
jgi:hypothetical protein